MMRTISVVAGLAVMLMSSVVFADDVGGTYEVKYEDVSNNCASPLKYPNGKMDIKLKGTQVTVDTIRDFLEERLGPLLPQLESLAEQLADGSGKNRLK